MNNSQEMFGKTPPYSFTKTIYYKPDGVNAKDYPDKIFYKKISRKNIRTITQAKQLFAEAEIKAKMAIEQKIAAYDEKQRKVGNGIFTVRKAHQHKLDGLKTATKKKYENIFKNYMEPFLDVDEDVSVALTPSKIDDFLEELDDCFEERELSYDTIYNNKRRIKEVIDYAIRRAKLDEYSFREIVLSKPQGNQVDYRVLWSVEQRDLFLDELKNGDIVYFIFYAILSRGLRFNEARGLRVNDIFYKDLEEGREYLVNIDEQTVNGSAIKTTSLKTQHSYRQINISKEVYVATTDYIKNQNLEENDFLFKSSSTQNIFESKALRKVFNEYKKEKTPDKLKMTPHKFRHIIAINALKNGKSVVSVAQHLGNTPGVVYKDYVLRGAMKESLLDV